MKQKNVYVGDTQYERIPIQTHLIKFGEDLIPVIERLVKPVFKPDDWLAVSEKVVSVSQNNVRHISTVKAGWLARIIVKGVKKYPNDIGFSKPEKMQLAVELAGRSRMVIAMIIGGIGKIFGIRGLFWRIAGSRASEIDGFNPDSMYPYTEYAALPPMDPEKVCEQIESKTGIPTVIIDGNNINVEVISMSRSVPIDTKTARLILLDNPMGQDNEMTPFVLVKRM